MRRIRRSSSRSITFEAPLGSVEDVLAHVVEDHEPGQLLERPLGQAARVEVKARPADVDVRGTVDERTHDSPRPQSLRELGGKEVELPGDAGTPVVGQPAVPHQRDEAVEPRVIPRPEKAERHGLDVASALGEDRMAHDVVLAQAREPLRGGAGSVLSSSRSAR